MWKTLFLGLFLLILAPQLWAQESSPEWVGDVGIRGSYPFLSARVKRIIGIRPGDPYKKELVEEQARKIEQLYEREGFEKTRVEVQSLGKSKNGYVDINYRIHKGGQARIGDITVEENTVFPRGYFISQINPLLPYKPSRLRASLKKIQRDYQKKGYLGARVRLKKLEQDSARHQVNLTLEIHQGDKVRVTFQGNKRVSTRTFHRILPLFTEGGYGAFDVESSIEEAKRYYHQHGFTEVTVTATKKVLESGSPESGSLLIAFEIEEGPQTRIKKIALEGNERVSDRRLKKDLVSKEEGLLRQGFYRPDTIEKDFITLPDLYRKRGFREATTQDKGVSFSDLKDKARVRFQVSEGAQTLVGRVELVADSGSPDSGKPDSGKLRKRLSMTEGSAFSEERLAADKELMVAYYADRGYPYVIVTHDVDIHDHQATITYKIASGPLVKIGKILIVGNRRTDARAIRRIVSLKSDQPFSYRKLLESETSLRKLAAFRSVSVETLGLTEQKPVVDLLVKLEENKSLVTDLEVSFSTDDKFTGALNIQDLNLFDIAKRANMKLILGQKIGRGEVSLADPHFFGSRLETIFSVFYEQLNRPGFDTKEVGGSVSLLHDFTSHLRLLNKYQVDKTTFSNVTDPAEGAEHDNTTSRISTSVSYDWRDSFSDPRDGYLLVGGLDIGNKITSSGKNFIQPKLQFVHYTSFSNFTWFHFIRGEGVQVFGGGDLPRDDRLFLGGDYSIRGFDEDRAGEIGADNKPTGGTLLFAYTTEIQMKLAKGFKLAAFLDSGSLTDSFGEIGAHSFRHSAGAGLRYTTPIGPLRLDYGIKLDRRPGESFGRLHFAFGYLF